MRKINGNEVRLTLTIFYCRSDFKHYPLILTPKPYQTSLSKQAAKKSCCTNDPNDPIIEHHVRYIAVMLQIIILY
jgi:hypothetical protein